MKHTILILSLACSASLAHDSVIADSEKLREITKKYRSDPERPKDFVPQGDGTVIDTRTGLQWMQCSVGQTWEKGEKAGDSDVCSGEADRLALEQAKELNLDFAGHNDWRLPTLAELQTLVFCDEKKEVREHPTYKKLNGSCFSSKQPSIATQTFPNTQASNYLSSSTSPERILWIIADVSWMVRFSYGKKVSHPVEVSYPVYIRLVRTTNESKDVVNDDETPKK